MYQKIICYSKKPSDTNGKFYLYLTILWYTKIPFPTFRDLFAKNIKCYNYTQMIPGTSRNVDIGVTVELYPRNKNKWSYNRQSRL